MPPILTLDFVLEGSVPQTAFGIFIIGLVLGVNGFAYMATIIFFRSHVGKKSNPSKLKATFFFIVCTQLLALTQLVSICIWSAALVAIGLSADWFSALRLSASSYTTLGNYPGVMRDGWHMIPAFIAFSGLFSFAWAASSTISMVSSLNNFLDSEMNSTI